MYQEKERKLPIDLAFPHSLDRQITVRIPQGYKVTNPEAVRFDVVHRPQDGTRSMGFVSDYKMEGDAMVITITEYYNLLHYPKSEIGNFRKVINAAADFNKVVLVLEKS